MIIILIPTAIGFIIGGIGGAALGVLAGACLWICAFIYLSVTED